MALDIGISALNMMFKLAKAIKEAQTDVLFIIDKVNDAESLSRLVEVNMNRLDLNEIPEGIYKEILKRNVAAKRLTRKLRLKYEPLLSLFSSLGGNATAIKVQASMLKRSVDGGAMGLNSLCILVDRHLNRTEVGTKDAILNALKEMNRSVDKYEKYSLAEMCKIMREADEHTKTQFNSAMALFDKLCGGGGGGGVGLAQRKMFEVAGQAAHGVMQLDPRSALSALEDKSRGVLSSLSEMISTNVNDAIQQMEQLADQGLQALRIELPSEAPVDDPHETDTFSVDAVPVTPSSVAITGSHSSSGSNSVNNSLKAKREQAIKLGTALHSPKRTGQSKLAAPLSPVKKRPLGTPKDLTEEETAAIALQRIAKQKLHKVQEVAMDATTDVQANGQAANTASTTTISLVVVEDDEAIATRLKLEKQEAKLKWAKEADALHSAQLFADTRKMFSNFCDGMAAVQAAVESDIVNEENSHLIPAKRAELRALNAEYKAKIHKKAALVTAARAEIARRTALVEKGTVKRTGSILSKAVTTITSSETVEEHQRIIAEISAELVEHAAELEALRAEHDYEAQERIDEIMGLLPPMITLVAPLLPAGITIPNLIQGEVPVAMKSDVDFIEDAGLSFASYEMKGVMNDKARLLLKDITDFISAIRQMNKEANIEDDEEDGCNAPDELYTAQSSIKRSSLKGEHERSPSVLAKGMDLIVQRISKGGTRAYLDDADVMNLIGKHGTQSMVGVLRRFIMKGARQAPDEQCIDTEKLVKYLKRDMKKNIGLRLAAFCMCMVDKLSPDGFPALVAQAIETIESLIQPLLNYATSLGIMLAIEHIREVEKDNPAEILALEAEADEMELESRLNLISTFADDLKDSFEHGFAPDPSMMLSIAIEVSNSFFGFGPTTKRRLTILKNIMGVMTVQKDRFRIESVDASIKNELVVIQSLPKKRSHVEVVQATSAGGSGNASAAGMDANPFIEQQKLMMELLMAQKHSYDVRNILGENTEASKFWITSFGKECYEVMWLRFRTAFLLQYGNTSEKYLLKIRPMLIDFRGIVTIEALVDVIKQYGNFSEVLARGGRPIITGAIAVAGSGSSVVPSSGASASSKVLSKRASKKMSGMDKADSLASAYLVPERSFKKASSVDSFDVPVLLERGSSSSSLVDKAATELNQGASFTSQEEGGGFAVEGFEVDDSAGGSAMPTTRSPSHNLKSSKAYKRKAKK